MKYISKIPANVTRIAIGLCDTLFLYLFFTGIQSLGIGEMVPAVVSQVFFVGLLLIAVGTAVVNAYLGGRLSSSIVSMLAIAVGLSLFLIAESSFQLGATVSDLPVQFTVLFYLIVAVVVGLIAFLFGRASVGVSIGSALGVALGDISGFSPYQLTNQVSPNRICPILRAELSQLTTIGQVGLNVTISLCVKAD